VTADGIGRRGSNLRSNLPGFYPAVYLPTVAGRLQLSVQTLG